MCQGHVPESSSASSDASALPTHCHRPLNPALPVFLIQTPPRPEAGDMLMCSCLGWHRVCHIAQQEPELHPWSICIRHALATAVDHSLGPTPS